nr:non-functional pseudokinase ZED1-like [Malus domestica]
MPSKLVKLFPRLPFFRKKEREWSYYKNLKKLLEDLFASGDGESHPIHCYSADDIIRATNNFHPSRIVTKSSGYKMFRGLLDGRSIIVAKYRLGSRKEDWGRSCVIRDIVISLQMSHHENVLKLLGCCLEFPIPVLVHEYVAKGVLNPDGSLRGANEDQIILPWNIRLRIAKQVASAVSYLHTAFAGHIIYVDLKPSCLFLDDDYVPKLYVFSHSITIPPVESDVEDDVTGTIGYIDPVYLWCKTDIYSFGVLLLVFLTGGKAVESDQVEGIGSLISYVQGCHCRLEAIVDPKIYEEVRRNVQVRHQLQHQLHDFLNLALLCIDRRTEGRRCMVDVARALIRIEECRRKSDRETF